MHGDKGNPQTFAFAVPLSPAQLQSEKARLDSLREENKLAEANLRKSKKRAQQDVESVIGEYDQDLGSKEGEYQEVRGLVRGDMAAPSTRAFTHSVRRVP